MEAVRTEFRASAVDAKTEGSSTLVRGRPVIRCGVAATGGEFRRTVMPFACARPARWQEGSGTGSVLCKHSVPAATATGTKSRARAKEKPAPPLPDWSCGCGQSKGGRTVAARSRAAFAMAGAGIDPILSIRPGGRHGLSAPWLLHPPAVPRPCFSARHQVAPGPVLSGVTGRCPRPRLQG